MTAEQAKAYLEYALKIKLEDITAVRYHDAVYTLMDEGYPKIVEQLLVKMLQRLQAMEQTVKVINFRKGLVTFMSEEFDLELQA